MKKIILAVIFALAVNISTAFAASVAIYEGAAEELYEGLRDELENAGNVSYTVSNFRVHEAPNSGGEFDAWACDLSMSADVEPEAAITFLGSDDEVFLAMAFCAADTFYSNSDRMPQFLLITTLGMLEPCGLSESECDAFLAEVMNNPSGGDWSTWSQGKYFRIRAINENGICGFALSAEEGK